MNVCDSDFLASVGGFGEGAECADCIQVKDRSQASLNDTILEVGAELLFLSVHLSCRRRGLLSSGPQWQDCGGLCEILFRPKGECAIKGLISTFL